MEARAVKSTERYYILRPETVEAYFYLWRLTKDQKYRDWAWDAAQVGAKLIIGADLMKVEQNLAIATYQDSVFLTLHLVNIRKRLFDPPSLPVHIWT